MVAEDDRHKELKLFLKNNLKRLLYMYLVDAFLIHIQRWNLIIIPKNVDQVIVSLSLF